MEDKKIDIQDGFVECPHCHGQLCYAQRIGAAETWTCMSCGFSSSTLMKQGTETEQSISSKQPELYRDLKFVDEDDYVWYPAVMSVPEKGMVYVDGTASENWQWAATPVRKLTDKERRMKKYKDKEYISDMANTKYYGKDGFATAVTDLGMFD